MFSLKTRTTFVALVAAGSISGAALNPAASLALKKSPVSASAARAKVKREYCHQLIQLAQDAYEDMQKAEARGDSEAATNTAT